MRITYVLALPELNGGNKVVLQHADLLSAAGHEVAILAQGERPHWWQVRQRYVDLTVERPRLPPQDLVIGTYWTTLQTARELDLGPVAHFCQGYEGHLEHLRAELPRIEEVYGWPLPTLVVAPHLTTFLRGRFGRESRVAPPPLDANFRPALRVRPRRRPWIAVPGIFEAPVKGVRTALAAVMALRREAVPLRLLRFSVLPLSAAERELLAADEYLHAVPPPAVASALRRCDLLLLPSLDGEGFGLPLLEAMASGVPAVASRIASVEAMAADAAVLVAPGDSDAMAAAARRLLRSSAAWRVARRRGLAAAARYRPAVVSDALEAGVAWACARVATAP